MKNRIIWIAVSMLIFAGAVFVFVVFAGIYRFNFTDSGDVLPGVNGADVKKISYTVGNEVFPLVNGRAEKEIAPGSASKNVLTVFGEPVYGDLSDDGIADAALWLVNEPGGTGTFYYAVLAIKTGDTYKATNALILGDRIAPQTLEIHEGRAVFNYAERRADEPMTTPPSMGKSLYIQYVKATGEIGEWVKDFEGETNTVLTEAQARVIAERTCIKGGEALAAGTHNANSRTWWFDANLNATRPGCSPACVVSEDKESAVINWRCTGAIPPTSTGVKGRVLLGPTCPVMREPPDPQCADKPYATTIQVIEVGSPKSSPFTTAKSSADGTFAVTLPPGTYALQPAGGQPLPRCETKEVTIVAGKMLEVELACDSGIR